MRRIVLTLIAVVVAAGTTAAQAVRPSAAVKVAVGRLDADRAALGVSTQPDGMSDTLGLRVSAVVAQGPAEKAGIRENDRLQAINGVSLRLSTSDAGDPYMRNVAQARLTRELRKVQPGGAVTLNVFGNGRMRTVKVETTSARAMDSLVTAAMYGRLATADARAGAAHEKEATAAALASATRGRGTLGMYVGALGTARDTGGVFVQQVVAGGPAERAGIIEGDRVASINGVDLRVPREDAGDADAAVLRVARLRREMDKLHPGDSVTLVVVTGGRARTVRAVAADGADASRFGGMAINLPDLTVRGFPTADRQRELADEIRLRTDEIRVRAEEQMNAVRERLRDFRVTVGPRRLTRIYF